MGDVDAGIKHCCVLFSEGSINILSVGDIVYEAFTSLMFASSNISTV